LGDRARTEVWRLQLRSQNTISDEIFQHGIWPIVTENVEDLVAKHLSCGGLIALLPVLKSPPAKTIQQKTPGRWPDEVVYEDIAPTGQRLGLRARIMYCRAALMCCLISMVFSLQVPTVAQAQIQNSSFSSSLDDGPWQTFRNASTARPVLVSPQTGQLVPAPTGPLPSIGDVPQFSAPQFTSPQVQNPVPTPAPPGTQAFTDDFFSSPAQPSGSEP